MHKDDILPDSYTYSIILNGLKINNSSQHLVRLCLENIKKVIVADEIKHDVVLFNSLIDVSQKYNMIDKVEDFYKLMKSKGIKDTPSTCTVLVTAYTQADKFDESIEIFMKMMMSGMKIKESCYGLVLECCTRNKRMDLAL